MVGQAGVADLFLDECWDGAATCCADVTTGVHELYSSETVNSFAMHGQS